MAIKTFEVKSVPGPTPRPTAKRGMPIEIATAVAAASDRVGDTSVKWSGRRGRPRLDEVGLTYTATRPWEKAGMSERTWYRRKKDAGNE